jgi:molybdate transport system substrate-binding protein
VRWAFAVASVLLCAGCGGDDSTDTELTVLAAASLSGTFEELAERFEQDHRGVEVTLVFESSTTLATQVVDGAPGDVLATADTISMGIVTDADAANGEPTPLATNTLVLVVPPGNPADIGSLDDLERESVDWVMCDPSAPCGKLAETNLHAHGVTAEAASLEVDVRAVLSKVVSDEADAGLVYRTDAVSAGDAVQTIEIEGADEHRNEYLVVQVTDSDLAAEWVDLVTGSEGRSVLTDAGFGTP